MQSTKEKNTHCTTNLPEKSEILSGETDLAAYFFLFISTSPDEMNLKSSNQSNSKRPDQHRNIDLYHFVYRKIKDMDPKSPHRTEMSAAFLEKLYNIGLIPTKWNLGK